MFMQGLLHICGVYRIANDSIIVLTFYERFKYLNGCKENILAKTLK
jgi:hypothetical protein